MLTYCKKVAYSTKQKKYYTRIMNALIQALGGSKRSPKKKFIISGPGSENHEIINIEKCPTRGRGGEEGNLFFSESEYIFTFRIGDPALVKRNRVSEQWRLVLGC